ncbi:MAG TPA: DUF2946 family protein [Rhizomicrobium sp.]|nr:DUF2946 family protein [Rhizomicrobium sp.]
MSSGDRHFGLGRVRFIAALIALLSFTLQTYVVQTHIHVPGVEISGLGQVTHPSPLDNKNSQDDCPICQAFATAGSFVTPALIILALALSFIDASPFIALRTKSGPPPARNWQSRAPPNH